MAADETQAAHASSEGGVAGSHPSALERPVFVAPATENQVNVVTSPLIPIACWRVDDVRFDFASSFVLPDAARELKFLAELREHHKWQPADNGTQAAAVYPPVSIFGHADPVGNDDDNKKLSGRRATAVYALLTRKADLWEQLYAKPLGQDNWGVRSVQWMLAGLDYSPGEVDGEMGPNTRDAVTRFQKANGLAADGNPGPQTRAKLFLAYMDKLCGSDLKLDPAEDFLARGADTGGKGDRQGCGEFNPVLLFSQKEEEEYSRASSKQARNAANGPNRRVVALLFRPGAQVLAARWPCPRIDDGADGCRKRFWSDGEQRRTRRLPEERRSFEDSADTFACRFYHRLCTGSPCEGALPVFRVRLFDRFGRVIPHAPYSVTIDGTELPAGTANASGDIFIRHVSKPTSCLIRWSAIPPKDDQPIYTDAEDDNVPL